MPLVSVIIPTYNRAQLLGRAIRSVLSQTYRNFELIVVDDGSTDSTSEILSAFGRDVQVVYQENRGVSAARNTGIARSQGTLAAFLDSDDKWLPRKLERQMEHYCPSRTDFVCHTDEIWYRNGRVIRPKSIHRKQGGRFFERALERCLISPSSVVIARSLLDRVGWFDEELPAAEDYDLWLRITAFHEVDFVPEPLVIKYGGHGDQLSRRVPAIDRFRIRAIEKILCTHGLPERYRRAALKELVRKCWIVERGYSKRGNFEEAEAYYELACSYERDYSGRQ